MLVLPLVVLCVLELFSGFLLFLAFLQILLQSLCLAVKPLLAARPVRGILLFFGLGHLKTPLVDNALILIPRS